MESNQEDKGGAQALLEPNQEVKHNESVSDWVEQGRENEEESD